MKLPTIPPIDPDAARLRQLTLTKPPSSLGRLEELSIQLAGMTGNPSPKFERKKVIIMAGDHGVCAGGVSAYPSEVTQQMVFNFLHGGAAINALARQAGAKVLIVDMGGLKISHPSKTWSNAKLQPGRATSPGCRP